MAAGTQVLPDGVYTVSNTATGKVLDVAGGAWSAGANVQMWSSNATMAQEWKLAYDGAGFYTVTSVQTGMALDVSGANLVPGTNVQVWSPNSSDAQKWRLDVSGSSYTLVSKVNGLALDIDGASSANGANVQCYTANSSSAQKFTLAEVTSLISDGIYTVRTALASGMSLDIPGGALEDGASLQIYSANTTPAQKFRIASDGSGTYTIQPLCSGRYLAASGSKVVTTSKITKAAEWKAVPGKRGISFQNVSTSQMLDVSGAGTYDGCPVGVYASNSTAAQSFLIATADALNSGTYVIRSSAATDMVLDVVGGQTGANGANVQLWNANGTGAQAYNITCSGDVCTIAAAPSGKLLDVLNGRDADGTNVQLWESDGASAQKWRVSVTSDGCYTFTSLTGKRVLDVAGGLTSAGANVQIWTSNSSAAQKWHLSPTTYSGISGNAELDAYINSTLDSLGRDGDLLYKAYAWTCGRSWVNSSGSREYYGILSDSDSINEALYMFRTGSGDCYNYAATFEWLARGAGYSANARGGQVPAARGGLSPHGWTEVYIGGTTYVCDPNLTHDLPGYNFYLQTYATAPVSYYL